MRYKFDDVLEMIRHQIIAEGPSIELLNGQLVYHDQFDLVDGVVTLGPHHSYVNCALLDLMKQNNTDTRFVAGPYQLACTPWHVPIPDAAIMRGNIRDPGGLPDAPDALCVIEVADSS